MCDRYDSSFKFSTSIFLYHSQFTLIYPEPSSGWRGEWKWKRGWRKLKYSQDERVAGEVKGLEGWWLVVDRGLYYWINHFSFFSFSLSLTSCLYYLHLFWNTLQDFILIRSHPSPATHSSLQTHNSHSVDNTVFLDILWLFTNQIMAQLWHVLL